MEKSRIVWAWLGNFLNWGVGFVIGAGWRTFSTFYSSWAYSGNCSISGIGSSSIGWSRSPYADLLETLSRPSSAKDCWDASSVSRSVHSNLSFLWVGVWNSSGSILSEWEFDSDSWLRDLLESISRITCFFFLFLRSWATSLAFAYSFLGVGSSSRIKF
jgi:hypothetical protein